MANILHVVVRPYYITLACNQITSRGSCSKSRVHDLRPSAAKALEIAGEIQAVVRGWACEGLVQVPT